MNNYGGLICLLIGAQAIIADRSFLLLSGEDFELLDSTYFLLLST